MIKMCYEILLVVYSKGHSDTSPTHGILELSLLARQQKNRLIVLGT